MKITSDNWIVYWSRGMAALLFSIPIGLVFGGTIVMIYLFLVMIYIFYCIEKGHRDNMKRMKVVGR